MIKTCKAVLVYWENDGSHPPAFKVMLNYSIPFLVRNEGVYELDFSNFEELGLTDSIEMFEGNKVRFISMAHQQLVKKLIPEIRINHVKYFRVNSAKEVETCQKKFTKDHLEEMLEELEENETQPS